MNTKDKEILLKDLCARLPYGVKINETIQGDFTVIGLTTERVFTTCETEGCHNDFPIECIKPYLFPISNMPEEATREFSKTLDWVRTRRYSKSEFTWDTFACVNKYHIDYAGLIEKGLAIDATGKKIY